MSDTTLVALSPADMVPAQKDLIAWCVNKIRALVDEADEFELQQKLCLENGWKTSVVVNSLNRCVRRMRYYEKMKAALEAGYLLVPNMPVDVIAVRVNRAKQAETFSSSRWHHFAATPQASLPAGVGRYVDDELTHRDESYAAEKNDKGETKHVTHLVSDEYDDVDFPVVAMKPVILEAAARAMALKVFDQIGMVSNEGRDPILVGQLLDPRGNRRRSTFFIAWWVDPATL